MTLLTKCLQLSDLLRYYIAIPRNTTCDYFGLNLTGCDLFDHSIKDKTMKR
jgi:hypothetical protein